MSQQPHAAATAAERVTETPHAPGGHQTKVWPLALAALGIVYGDIGTSPLYAVKECFNGMHAIPNTRDNVFGVMSLFVWAVFLIVTVKYLIFVMRADNKGEGGLFSLLALIPSKLGPQATKMKMLVVMLGIFGAALLYGDGMITPAMSVLSAVEGLHEVTVAADKLVVPITLVILVGLFMIQRHGTAGIGRFFGPVMLLWFVAIAVLGLRELVKRPEILLAVNPLYGLQFLLDHGSASLTVLGSVVLCVTGAEALYADMGHFGRRAIQLSWLGMVWPCLLLNYFGQGALMLEGGARTASPFFGLVPEPLMLPMVVLATSAAVIASQAMISGAYSLTRQAVQLGFCPRVTIIHTSKDQEGQIYIPEVNQLLAVACVLLVLGFRGSTAIAAAYGIAVTGTFVVTTLVFSFVVTQAWKWPLWKTLPFTVTFLIIDCSFFGSTLMKFFDGGWVPMAVAVGIFALMTTWNRGRKEMGLRFAAQSMPLDALLEDLQANQPHRVRGTAVFMSGSPDGTPPVLLHHLKHNQILHRQVVLLSIISEQVPVVDTEDSLQVVEKENGFFRVIARTGFMQTPNVPAILKSCRDKGLVCEPSTTSYYLGRETLLTTGKSKMMRWRKALFAFVSRNSRSATAYFGIPPGRVVELGMQVDL